MSARKRNQGRDRTQRKKETGLPVLPGLFEPVPDCDCEVCTGEDGPAELVAGMRETAAQVAAFDDPLDAELVGALVLTLAAGAGSPYEQLLLEPVLTAFEAQADDGALAVLLAIGAVATGAVREVAAAAAGRLAAAGLTRPRWAGELDAPVRFSACTRLSDTAGAASALACVCQRGQRSHAFVIAVDELECGAADEIILLDPAELRRTLDEMRTDARRSGFEVISESLDGAAFRGYVEHALDSRAVHDAGDAAEELLVDLDGGSDEDEIEEDGPGYAVLAALLRARVAALPEPADPPPPAHGEREDAGDVDGPAMLRLLEQAASAGPLAALASTGFRARPEPLPAKRTKGRGPAPVYRIRVDLRGAKPPIWRRLDVPADISLAQLHRVLLAAFDWHGGHMHSFDTPYGEFGASDDADLGHRAESPVTLEQVAPAAKSKITYTYDFGDDWVHSIRVEKELEPAQATDGPRCVGGRRAAPPDDCGGMWGYADLIDIIADPAHPEHEEQLEWLGLADAASFDPECFDAERVNQRLARLG